LLLSDAEPLVPEGKHAGASAKSACGLGRYQIKSKAKLSGSVENLIGEMNKMLCGHRKTGVTSICGQID